VTVTVTDHKPADQQSWEVADCFFDLIGRLVRHADQLAQRMCIPTPFVKALHQLDGPTAMKELGKRMHCDPSFVTLMADMLEKRGLARREPHAADRRVKNLVLTDEGVALKMRVEAEILAMMPWNQALNETERAQLLALIRKMLSADDTVGASSTNDEDAGARGTSAGHAMADGLAGLLVASSQECAPQASKDNPPASTGEVTSS
jgi:DNA-binding MarR family transcriptional regulator